MGIEAGEFLKRVPIFSDCTDDEREAIASRVNQTRFQPGQFIVVQGTPGYALYVIISGCVQVIKDDSPLRTFHSGDFFGELSLLDESPRSASVLALEDTTCLMLPGWDFASLLKDQPAIAIKLLGVLSKRLRETAANQ